MSSKQLAFDERARQHILRGVEKLAKAVTVTLGPKGRNVLIDKKFGSPTATKDGVTVAKEIELECPFENMGAQMVRETASKTSDVAGDGTTTATVLAEAIYRDGLRSVTAGASPIHIQRGIQKAVDVAVAQLDKLSQKVKSKKMGTGCSWVWFTVSRASGGISPSLSLRLSMLGSVLGSSGISPLAILGSTPSGRRCKIGRPKGVRGGSP